MMKNIVLMGFMGAGKTTVTNLINRFYDVPDGKIRYTVPQLITEEKDVTLYFRTGGLYRNVKINVYADGNLALSKKKQRIAPSEMETLKISKKMLEGVSELRLELEETV